jgi:hypothetical protein
MDTPQTVAEATQAVQTSVTAVGGLSLGSIATIVGLAWRIFAKEKDLKALDARVTTVEADYKKLPDTYVTNDKMGTLEAKIDDVGKHVEAMSDRSDKGLTALSSRIDSLTNTLLSMFQPK